MRSNLAQCSLSASSIVARILTMRSRSGLHSLHRCSSTMSSGFFICKHKEHLRAQVASCAISDIVKSGSLLSTRKTMSEGGSLPTLLEQKRIQSGASYKLVGAAKTTCYASCLRPLRCPTSSHLAHSHKASFSKYSKHYEDIYFLHK